MIESTGLTSREVADRLGVSMRHVGHLRMQGRLHAHLIGPATRGGQWLYDAASVEALQAEWAAAPPKPGRRASSMPTPAALAQRRARARRADDSVLKEQR